MVTIKKIIGKLLRSFLITPVYCLAFILMIYKYSDSIAINMKINLDRLADKGGQRKRKR